MTQTSIQFEKFQGAGNDFIFIDACVLPLLEDEKKLQEIVIKICDRHFGVGADGVVFYNIDEVHDNVTASCLIMNSDGSTAAHCGNALRCFGLKLLQKNLWDGLKNLSVFRLNSTEVFATLVAGEMLISKHKATVQVAMGETRNVVLTPLVENSLASFGKEMDFLTPIFVELANPHWIFISPVFAHFTEKMFTEFGVFAQTELLNKIINKDHIVPIANIAMLTQNKKNTDTWELTVYERGAGLTYCCGSGATAARIALEFIGLMDKKMPEIKFKMPGGVVSVAKGKINTSEQFILKGPAQWVYSGNYFFL